MHTRWIAVSAAALTPFLLCPASMDATYNAGLLSGAEAGLVETAIQAKESNAAPAEPVRIELGKPLDRAMHRGETHAYTIHAEQGQFVHVVVLQQGIDVAVSLFDPQGKQLAMTDSLNGLFGPEPISAITEVPGDFLLKIVAGTAAPGHYRVTLTDLRPPAQVDQTRMDAERTYMEGIMLYARGDAASFDAAAGKFHQSGSFWQSLDDEYGQSLSLFSVGQALQQKQDLPKALESYNQALSIFRATGDRAGEANTLTALGGIYTAQWEPQKALEYLNQAIPAYRAIDDWLGEANSALAIGMLYSERGENQKALEYLNQSLPLFRTVGFPVAEAGTLNNIGQIYITLGEMQKALEYLNQALPIFRALGDRAHEATVLNNIALVYSTTGEKEKALEIFNQALATVRAVGNRAGEAIALSNIGPIYNVLGEKQKALESLNQAVTIFHSLGDRHGEAVALDSISIVYWGLGDRQKALEVSNQVLLLAREIGDRTGEATTLNNIGRIYGDLGEQQKALEYFKQALPIVQAVGYRAGESVTLSNLAMAYSDTGDKQKALDLLNRALPLSSEVGDRHTEAAILSDLGYIYSELGQKGKARDLWNQALPLAVSIKDPLLEGAVLGNLVHAEREQHPALAIFYAKQAVNLLQQVRGNIQGLDKELQSKFLDSNSDYYRVLADLLIEQGRLPEAQQILDLLKRQEFSDYVRGDPAKILGPVSLTPAEQQAEEDYQKSTAQLVAQTDRWNTLKKNKARTPEEEAEFQRVSHQLDEAGKGLEAYYSRLYTLFGQGSAANREKADVQGNVTNLNQLVKNSPRVVALYTTVTKDRISLIVIAGSAIVARESSIASTDLNKKIADFQQALRSPNTDPRPLAEDLYKVLIQPVKPDLDQAKAETLVWSLDGVLRYIPLGALYDGKHYLVENYNIVTFTPASIPYLSQKPEMDHVSAVAMGISRQYEDALKPLPAVETELEDIVKDPQLPGANGVLPGSILLNAQFTEKAMEGQLDSSHAIVHIASHFVFKPGDDNASYLLLAGKDAAGAGYHLTVRDFNANKNLSLDSTDLLTLSACETGMSGHAGNGEEIDGLGAVAQNKGARAIISSLWEVDDASTGELMADFYKRWAGGDGKVMKVEALRQAQLDLLRGTVTPPAAPSARGSKPDQTDPSDHERPTGYTHPYYWAPFVLTGNWR